MWVVTVTSFLMHLSVISFHDEKIFLRYTFIQTCMFFFSTNALTQRTRSSAKDSSWKEFICTSKKNCHRDRWKFYVNERRRVYFGLSDRAWLIERRNPWYYQGWHMLSFALQIFRRRIIYYKISRRNFFAFSGERKHILIREILFGKKMREYIAYKKIILLWS